MPTPPPTPPPTASTSGPSSDRDPTDARLHALEETASSSALDTKPDLLAIPEALRKPVDHPSLHRRRDTGPSGLHDVMRALALGVDFLVTTAAGGALGWAADYFLIKAPSRYGMLVGIFLGFIVATVRIIQRTSAPDRKP